MAEKKFSDLTREDIAEMAETASSLKASGKCNCTQAVLEVFKDIIPADHETLMKLSSGFAAGMGCMESTCGALTGAVMVAGIAKDGRGTAGVSAKLLKNFQKRSGATICRELKGIETGKVLCPCPDCVKNAVLALGDELLKN